MDKKNSVLRAQIFSICDDQEKELFEKAEYVFGGIDEVAILLAECKVMGIAGQIRFSDVRNVANSKVEKIHPNYLKMLKDVYLRHLLKLLFAAGRLDIKIAEKYEIERPRFETSWVMSEK